MAISLYETVVQTLATLGRAAEPAGVGEVALALDGKHGRYAARLHVDDDRRTLVLRVASPVRIEDPLACYGAAELLLRTGFGLPVGGVDLAFDTGEVRYRAGVDLGVDGALTPRRLTRLLDAAVVVLDWIYPGLVAVARGTQDPYFVARELGVEQSDG